jgi:two-component system phosphate regulon sensor histidine kinase PhoR
LDSSSERRGVWVVDDTRIESERARRWLAQDYDVEVFDDGSTALERLTVAPPPDVIVCDWVMPGITGIEVCRFISASPTPAISQIGILLLTSQRRTEQIVEGLAAGASDYLAKPYEHQELQARVGALVRTRRLLERLEAVEGVNRRLLATAPDALLSIDGDGLITFANEEAIRTLGADPASVVGKPLAALLPSLALGNLSWDPGKSHFPLPDVPIGERFFAPIIRILPTASTAHMTIALRDVTDRRRSDTRRLDFYAVIAHDLRSPLSTVLMRTDMILRGTRGALPAKVVEDLRKIDGNVKSLVTMINDFLEVARLEGTGYRIQGAPLDLAALVDSVMEDFAPLVETSRLTWRAERPERPALVMADTRRLTQVLTNLIANAIKFTPGGGSITTRVRVVGSSVELSVEDTGQGIAPEAIPTIFERYTRAPDMEHKVAGTGLGLMIVRDVIQAHGGSVGVESTPGAGSRFWIRLPEVAAAAAARVDSPSARDGVTACPNGS